MPPESQALQPNPVDAVLFDLDGTLVDTAPDLAWCLNQVRQEQGLASLPFETIRPHVSNGSAELIRCGFELTAEHPQFEALRLRLLEVYSSNLLRESTLFSGMAELLDYLEDANMPWGIVTNKPAWLTDPLVEQMGLKRRAACVISGDTTAHSKPHPEPLLHASRLLGISPPRCLYIGDAERDIEAGKRAGMPTLVALFGYIEQSDQPQNWGADHLVADAAEIIDWLRQHAPLTN